MARLTRRPFLLSRVKIPPMKLKLLSALAVLLFMAGAVLQLAFSSSLVWAETEASIYGTQVLAGGLDLRCPLLLSSSESGMASAFITNPLDHPVPPLITAEVSRAGGMQSLSQTLPLAPHETRMVRWPVDDSDVIFGRLILVNVIQAGYGDLDPRRGFCGILIFNLFNLTGNQSLILIFAAGVALIVMGGTFWIRIHSPLDPWSDQTVKACGALAGVITLASLSALPRWWGIALALDAFALIMLSVIFTDFLLFPKSNPA